MRILYVDIDTLRADHLSRAGYHRRTTPHIDALAADGVLFTQVYASDVPCLPSRTALATGTFGTRNGVINHMGAAADLRHEGRTRPFMSTAMRTSWACRLFFAGWHTASLSSFPMRHSASWWTHGYLESMNLMRGFGDERADQVLPGALDWLDRRGKSDQWFLHVHLWDPHKAAKDVEIGDFYFKRKNYRAAEDRYREALLYKDNDATATFRLGECLEKLGQPGAARDNYESYLKILPHGPFAEEARKSVERLKKLDSSPKPTK